MKNLLHRTIATFFSLVVLLSTTSFSVDMHYCGETLVEYSFYAKTAGCGMEKSLNDNSCDSATLSSGSCCSDHQIAKAGQDDLNLAFNDFTPDQQLFVATFFYSYLSTFEGIDTHIIPFKEYSPPFIERDMQILHEQYLI